MLVEVGSCRSWDDRGHRHGEKLGKDIQRLLESEDHSRIVGDAQALELLVLAVGKGAGAKDRIEWPAPATGRAGRECAEERGAHITSGDGSAVVKGGAL